MMEHKIGTDSGTGEMTIHIVFITVGHERAQQFDRTLKGHVDRTELQILMHALAFPSITICLIILQYGTQNPAFATMKDLVSEVETRDQADALSIHIVVIELITRFI